MQPYPNQQWIEELHTKIQNSPGTKASYQQLAWILYSDGRLKDVHTVLQEAILRFPEDPELHYLDGLVSKKQGSMLNARRSFSKVVALSGDTSDEVRSYMLHHMARRMLDILSD